MRKNVCGIYIIENIINGNIYIGQSTDIYKRFYEHRYRLSKKYHNNPKLQNAWLKYGGKNFNFRIIHECHRDKLNIMETNYIEQYRKKFKLYNLKDGGSNPKLSKETREKIRIANIGRIGTMLGKKHSEESKRKISEANKGRKMSEEHKKTLAEFNKNKIVSEETREKIRQARKLQIITDATKAKMSLTRKGKKTKPCSNETKEKLRQINLGKKLSEETKKKIGQRSLGHKLDLATRQRLSDERKGQNGPSSKLNDDQVLKIKYLISQGVKGREIASLFNMSEQTICDIKRGRCWSHI